MKENCFTLKKARSRKQPAQTIMDEDYTDDITLLANTPAQAQSPLVKAAGGIGLPVNADKTEYMRFNQYQTKDISTLTDSSLNLGDKFTYLRSSILSNENGNNT